jgi:hypothetical protein
MFRMDPFSRNFFGAFRQVSTAAAPAAEQILP